jgi:membrane associated rhomboid family serine protease
MRRAGRGPVWRVAVFAAYCGVIAGLHLLAQGTPLGVVAWQAHLGGFLTAWLAGALLPPDAPAARALNGGGAGR